MDALKYIDLGLSYFATPEYMIVQTWKSIRLLYLDDIVLTGSSLYKYTKFYLGVIGYTLTGVPCDCIAVALSICLHTIVTAYPMV